MTIPYPSRRTWSAAAVLQALKISTISAGRSTSPQMTASSRTAMTGQALHTRHCCGCSHYATKRAWPLLWPLPLCLQGRRRMTFLKDRPGMPTAGNRSISKKTEKPAVQIYDLFRWLFCDASWEGYPCLFLSDD